MKDIDKEVLKKMIFKEAGNGPFNLYSFVRKFELLPKA
jgi:hypothetical protein